MSANICEKKVCFYGVKPWHGIGTELASPATAQEAIVAAGLDYDVQRNPVFSFQDGNKIEIPEKYSTLRIEKDGRIAPLGIVGERYEIIQNKDAFGFFDEVVASGEAKYHVAGALGRGEKIWLLAKLPNNTLSFKGDVVEKYLCLANSHDGSSALKCFFTGIRVVCQNTLTLALKDAKNGVSIRHSGDLEDKVNEARRVLGLSLDFFATFDESAKVLASKQVSVKEAEGYVNNVLEIKDEEKASSRAKNQRGLILDLFDQEGQKLPELKGTAWLAYNAVVANYDHFQTVKGVAKDPTNRLKSIWFGAAAESKARAFDLALELVKN